MENTKKKQPIIFKNDRFADNLEDIYTKRLLLHKKHALNKQGETLLKERSTHPIPYITNSVRMMTAPFLNFDVNVWFLQIGNETLIIDTSSQYQHLEEGIKNYSLKPTHVLLTHEHKDHIGGLKGLRAAYPEIKTEIPSYIESIPTPGHCEVHLSYYLPKEGICFCGDALFSGSMGKPNYSGEESLRSVEKLLALPPETILYPGHGAATSVAWERKYNCFHTE